MSDAAAELLERLAALGVSVSAAGGKLRVRGAKRVLTAELRAELERWKPALLERLAEPGELAPRPADEPPRLSFAQQRLWFLQRFAPKSAGYNVDGALRLSGELDVDALRAALRALVERHEVLRTRFPERDGEPVARVAAPDADSGAVLRVADAPDPKSARALAAAELERPFDLAHEAPFRATLVRAGGREHVLALVLHHVAADGTSLAVLERDLARLYTAASRGDAAALESLPVQYADYARWQAGRLRGERLERLLRHWTGKLAGAEPLELPTDRPRPPVQRFRGACLTSTWPPELQHALEETGRRAGATLFATLLAAFAVLLRRASAQEDLLLGAPVSMRERAELEGLIGCFLNMLALRVDVSGDPRFDELLGRVRAEVLASLAHQELPFERLVEALVPERDPGRNPLFQVTFALHEAPARPAPWPRLAVERLEHERRHTNFDLEVHAWSGQGGLRVDLVYATNLFDEATVQGWARTFRAIAEAVARDPRARLSRLAPAADAERARLVGPPCPPASAEGSEARVHALFAAQVARTPGAVAVSSAGETRTYAQLFARADAIARALRERGVAREALVGLCLERGVDLPAAVLGVLAAGGSYLPIDPALPRERIAWTLADAGAELVLADRASAAGLPDAASVVCLEDVDAPAASSAELDPRCWERDDVRPTDRAYVIYTSGSTGTPKGVEVEHASVASFLRSMRREPGLAANDVLLAVTTLSFDIAGLELLLPLTVGARVEIASRETAADGRRLARALGESGATVMQATPATWSLLLEAGWEGDGALRMLCGGEELTRPLAERLLARGGELWNLYGPTETTIWSAVGRVRAEDGADAPVPLGAPVDGTQLHVLDGALRPVRRGEPGELCIGGVGLARGYLNRPSTTAERFVPSPWPAASSGRLYRTGDRVRLDAAGRLRFLGRLDQQVKLRGHRIEPGEIEAALVRHPDVSRAAVVVHAAGPDDRRLVAYVVPAAGSAEAREGGEHGGTSSKRGDANLTPLREHLQARLPRALVPSHFVRVDALPLTPSGKVDRRALAARRPVLGDGNGGGAEHVAPRGPLERTLEEAFAGVLGRERVGVEDDFFALGGHSLLATRLVSRVRDALGVELPLSRVFEAPTVAALARAVEERRGEVEPGATAPVPRAPRDADLPLSFAQQRLWFLDRMGAGAAYHMRVVLGLEGELDAAALERALALVVGRHEALRTRFDLRDGAPRQAIEPPAAVPVARADLRGVAEPERDAALRAHVAREAARPFDLLHGPLLRASLATLAPGRHVLALVVHHAALDGGSVGVLVRELAAAYAAEATGSPLELPPLPIQYADYAAWQRARAASPAASAGLEHWRRRLAGVPGLDLPTDRPRPPVQTFAGATHDVELGPELASALRGLARSLGATLAMTGLALFQALLSRWTGQEDVVVGSPIAGRTRAELEPLIGLFVDSLVLRTDLGGDPTFAELVGRVRRVALDAYDHQDVPFERLVDELAPERDLGRTPLFQVVFAVQDVPPVERAAAGVTFRALPDAVDATRYELELYLFERPDGIAARWVYATELFDRATIERMADHFARLLAGAAADPGRRLSRLPMLAPAEVRRELVEWGDGGPSRVEGDALVHELFEARARERPESTAAVYRERSLTYAELNAEANRIAHALRARGVRGEELVGLCLEPGFGRVATMLGILKAGGAYVPLDPDYPHERLAFLLADSGVARIVTEERLLPRLGAAAARALCLDRDRAELAAAPTADPARPAGHPGPDGLAYAIYTSGSTGRPKAALLAHRGIVNVAREQARRLGAGPSSRVLQFASLGFDAATFEVVMALANGGATILGDRDELRPGPDLVAFLVRNAVSLVTLPPSALAVLPAAELPALRTITVAGEACPAELVRRWAPGRRFFDLYGPTEATIWSTVARLEPGDEPHIGRAIGGVQVVLVDRRGAPVPVGVAGELWIGGAGVARGYHGRAALTAERFVPSPRGMLGPEGVRFYRTGDLGRRRPDGTIEFLGRLDQQVKLRGHRIELGEVEAALERHPAVARSVAVVREDVPGDRRLVAYVVPSEEDGEGEGAREREERHVAEWRALYEDTYGAAEAPAEPDFHVASWNSSYTGAPLPADEMREWVERTVDAVLAVRPRRVLELGCGTGLLLFRIAPHCEVYRATDLSLAALDHVRANLGALADRVVLEPRAAHELEGIELARYDAVVLSSVAQYLPSADHLVRVIAAAARRLRPGGTLFVGDVRSLPLLGAFHASVELHGADDQRAGEALRRRAHGRANQERELVLDPALFLALEQHVPGLRVVAIEPKRGRYDNELSRFRYDVRLRWEPDTPADARAEEIEWIDWGELGDRAGPAGRAELADLERRLAAAGGRALGVSAVPNARTRTAVEAGARLAGDRLPADAGALRRELAALAASSAAPDPEDLHELAERHGRTCATSWAAGRADGSFDAVFRPRSATGAEVEPPLALPPRAPRRSARVPGAPGGGWSTLANRPLRGRRAAELVPALRAELERTLPAYMVPSAIELLDALPVTPNGKLDRRALPAPDALRPELADGYVAPRDATERALAEVWASALGVERVGVRDNFFALGGDSILTIRLVSAARERGLVFTARDLFEHQTVAALAPHAARAADAGAPGPEPEPAGGEVSLTPIQRWYLEPDPADAHRFDQTLALTADAPLDPEHAARALACVVARHDALRTRFLRTPDGWRAEVGPVPDASPLVVADLGGLDAAERERRIRAEAERTHAAHRLADGELVHAALLRGAEDGRDVLLLSIHHLGVDAVSWRVLIEDLSSALAALRAGAEPELSAPASSFRARALRLAEAARTPAAAREAEAWLRLPWSAVAPLPRDASGTGGHGEREAGPGALEVALSPEETRALLSRGPAATADRVVLAALALALADWTGGRVVSVELEGHGRDEPPGDTPALDVSRTVGWHTALFPVALELPRGRAPGAVLAAVARRCAELPRGGMAFGLVRELAADTEPGRRLRAIPRPEVAFNWLGRLDALLGTEQDGALLRPARVQPGSGRSPRQARAHRLEVNAAVQEGRLRVRWEWTAPGLAEASVRAAAGRFAAALRELLMASPEPAGSPESAAAEAAAAGFGWSADQVGDILAELERQG